jgi:hypothetical protein
VCVVELYRVLTVTNARAQNWGLITFRQTALLYDPQQSSSSDKQRVAVVIAHELAHQWFGNLVTMKVSSHTNRTAPHTHTHTHTCGIDDHHKRAARLIVVERPVAQ